MNLIESISRFIYYSSTFLLFFSNRFLMLKFNVYGNKEKKQKSR